MTMSKQHFELIADTINDLFMGHENWQRNLNQVAQKFAEALAETNPNFNQERFLKACGLESEDDK